MSFVRTVNPNRGVVYRRVVEKPLSNDSLPGYGPVVLMNRPMRTRLWGGVGAGGAPPVTRFALPFMPGLPSVQPLPS